MPSRILIATFISFLLLCAIQGYGQNLVRNPGFEEKNKCPNDRGQIFYEPAYSYFPTVTDWVSPLNTTPDYFNRCATSPAVRLPNLQFDGYHQPHGGDACVGISLFSGHPTMSFLDYWAEYLETKLMEPMIAGHSYYVSYYVCRTNHLEKSYNIIDVDNIGARLTKNMIDTVCQAPLFFISGPPDIHTPPGQFISDTVNWTLVSGVYVAKGGEEWLTIGRFYSKNINYGFVSSPISSTVFDDVASTCYMLVDDVCVIDMDHPQVLETDVYTPHFPVTIGSEQKDAQYRWENKSTDEQITVTQPGTYTRQRWSDCDYYLDKYTVKEAPLDFCVVLPSAFTPNGDGRNDYYGPGNNNCHNDLTDYCFKIYNRFGQLVFQSLNPEDMWDGNFNGAAQEVGVYYYTFRYRFTSGFALRNKTPGATEFVTGDVTLIR